MKVQLIAKLKWLGYCSIPFMVAGLVLLFINYWRDCFCLRQWESSKIDMLLAAQSGKREQEIAAAKRQLFFAKMNSSNPLNIGISEADLARLQLESKDYFQAKNHARLAVDLFTSCVNSGLRPTASFASEQLISSLCLLGRAEQKSGQIQDSIQHYAKAHSLFSLEASRNSGIQKQLSAREFIDSMVSYADCLNSVQQSSLSQKILQESIELCQNIGKLTSLENTLREKLLSSIRSNGGEALLREELEWKSLIDKAELLESSREFEKASVMLLAAHKLAKEANGSEALYEESVSLARIANNFVDRFKYLEALDAADQALKILSDHKIISDRWSKRELKRLYFCASISCFKLDKFVNRVNIFEQEYKLRSALEGHESRKCLLAQARLALCLARNHNIVEAKRRATFCSNALAKLSTRSDKQEALIYQCLGKSFFECGDYSTAASSFSLAYDAVLNQSTKNSGFANLCRAQLTASLLLSGIDADKVTRLNQENLIQFANCSYSSEDERKTIVRETLYPVHILNVLKQTAKAKQCMILLGTYLRTISPEDAKRSFDSI